MNDLLLGVRLVHRAMRYRWLDRREIGVMLDHLPRGGTALDVGAHKGGYCWWMTRAVGPGGRVYAFEPQARVADPTARALRSLGKYQVRVVQAAVSDRSGRASISVRTSSTHGASLDGLEGPDIQSVSVPILSLDDFARRESLSRVDFIKIDVEGHELRVLDGAMGVLKRFGPALLVEVEDRHHDDQAEANAVESVRHILEPLGYRGWFFTRSTRRPIVEFRAAEHQQYGRGFYSNNFFFERPSDGPASG